MTERRYTVERTELHPVAYQPGVKPVFTHLFSTEWNSEYGVRETMDFIKKYPSNQYRVTLEERQYLEPRIL